MPLLQYIVRMSICLALMYLFYRLVLKKFTFYQYNRLYLTGYSLLCYILPVINISRLYQPQSQSQLPRIQQTIISTIPQVALISEAKAPSAQLSIPDYSTLVIWIIALGMSWMFFRLLLQIASIQRLKYRSRLMNHSSEFKLYQVDDQITPFSFGKSIFINEQLHTKDEIEKILIHELVHVNQNHTVDILWAELMVIINWFNPFAWKLRKAIKENIEYIADEKVIQSGINKRQYQYLLLQVTGNSPYQPISPFNFSSLKNRIIMMNKSKTGRIQLLKFLFLLPLLAVLLISFREAIPRVAPNIQFYGVITSEANHQPVSNAIIMDAENNISAVTNHKGQYNFSLPASQSIKLPVQLLIKKEGFNPTTLQLKTLKDKKGQANSIFMANTSLQPKGSLDRKPTSVVIGSPQGTENYKRLKQGWDKMNTDDPLLIKDTADNKLNLAGIVINSETFAPLSEVIIQNNDKQVLGKTDKRGFYSVRTRPNRGTANTYHLLFVKQGYNQLPVNITSKSNAENANIIENAGMTDVKNNDKITISFTQSMAQSSEITYQDAFKLLIEHNEQAEIEKKVKAQNMVLVRTPKKIFIVGKNTMSSLNTTGDPKIMVDGQQMSFSEVNQRLHPEDLKNTSLHDGEINITTLK